MFDTNLAVGNLIAFLLPRLNGCLLYISKNGEFFDLTISKKIGEKVVGVNKCYSEYEIINYKGAWAGDTAELLIEEVNSISV